MHSKHILFRLVVGVLGGMFLLLSCILYTARPNPPGRETLALESELRPYIGGTLDAVAARFGEPDDGYYPTINGVVYAGWIYRRKDGQVRVMGQVRANTVESVFAEH
jgi:hypothetical protein